MCLTYNWPLNLFLILWSLFWQRRMWGIAMLDSRWEVRRHIEPNSMRWFQHPWEYCLDCDLLLDMFCAQDYWMRKNILSVQSLRISRPVLECPFVVRLFECVGYRVDWIVYILPLSQSWWTNHHRLWALDHWSMFQSRPSRANRRKDQARSSPVIHKHCARGPLDSCQA